MALVAFIRGVNVGGHRRLRPSLLAKQLRNFDVVNVGGAGTFVIRSPGTREQFQNELRKRLPFETEIMICDGREIAKMKRHPFEPPRAGIVRFVSILSQDNRKRLSFPLSIPQEGKWFVRILAKKRRFVFGVYRHHMKTISYLAYIDRLFGVPVTTRNWNTIVTLSRTLRSEVPTKY